MISARTVELAARLKNAFHVLYRPDKIHELVEPQIHRLCDCDVQERMALETTATFGKISETRGVKSGVSDSVTGTPPHQDMRHAPSPAQPYLDPLSFYSSSSPVSCRLLRARTRLAQPLLKLR